MLISAPFYRPPRWVPISRLSRQVVGQDVSTHICHLGHCIDYDIHSQSLRARTNDSNVPVVFGRSLVKNLRRSSVKHGNLSGPTNNIASLLSKRMFSLSRCASIPGTSSNTMNLSLGRSKLNPDTSTPRSGVIRPATIDVMSKFIDTLPIRNIVNDYTLWELSEDEIWRRYQNLRVPRCLSIDRRALRLILDSLSKEKPRTKRGMLRYVSIIDEMLAQRPPLVPDMAEWTKCMSFLGRMHKSPTKVDLDKCLDLWNEMENRYNVRAGQITFNVLIDISIRVGQYAITNVLLKEMLDRGLQPDKYTWTSLIAMAGFMRNESEIRKRSRQVVDAGESIDTYILNTIMIAYVRAGHIEYAENLYQHIKQLALLRDEQTTLKDTCSFALGKQDMTLDLNTSASHEDIRTTPNHFILHKKHDHILQDLPLSVNCHPDEGTLNILLQHHCAVSGDFNRVTELLAEMDRFGIKDSITLFKSLFLGFATHGDNQGSWNIDRLDYVFKSLVSSPQIKLSQELSRLVIRSYGRLGTIEALQRTWRVLEAAWRTQVGPNARRSSNVEHELLKAASLCRARQSL